MGNERHDESTMLKDNLCQVLILPVQSSKTKRTYNGGPCLIFFKKDEKKKK